MRLDNKAKTAKANRNKGSRTNKNDPLQHDFYNDDHHKYLMPEMNEFINEDRPDRRNYLTQDENGDSRLA